MKLLQNKINMCRFSVLKPRFFWILLLAAMSGPALCGAATWYKPHQGSGWYLTLDEACQAHVRSAQESSDKNAMALGYLWPKRNIYQCVPGYYNQNTNYYYLNWYSVHNGVWQGGGGYYAGTKSCSSPLTPRGAGLSCDAINQQAGASCLKIGNPINPAVANKFEVTSDLNGVHAAHRLKRYYNSAFVLGSKKGGFGSLWRHTYERSLEINGAFLVAKRYDANKIAFEKISGVWINGAGSGIVIQEQLGSSQ